MFRYMQVTCVYCCKKSSPRFENRLCAIRLSSIIVLTDCEVYKRKRGDRYMQFIIKAYDGEGMLEKRMEVRPRHLEGMNKLSDHIICAGGLLDEEGKMKGSALIMEFDSRQELDEYIKNEPYVLEGVWEKIDIDTINVVIANGIK